MYTSWAECSEHVLGVHRAVHKKYSSYAEAMAAFNSTINSMPSSKPSSLSVTESGETTSPMSHKNVIILFLCALVAVMWMGLNRCSAVRVIVIACINYLVLVLCDLSCCNVT